MLNHDWRLVCHSCGEKYPVGTAMPLRAADCCETPRLHVHSLEDDDGETKTRVDHRGLPGDR